MVGLLVKDICLLFGQRRFLTVVWLVAFFFLLGGQEPMVAVSYVTLLSSFFTLSTISYDEFQHGFLFLFTLPVSRRGYVLEKYLYGALTGGTAWLISMSIGAIQGMLTNPTFVLLEWVASSMLTVLVLGCIISLTLPLEFKFGMEKSRTVLFVITFLLLGIFTVVAQMDGVTEQLKARLLWFSQLGAAEIVCGVLLLFAAVTALSIGISIRVMEKKQF